MNYKELSKISGIDTKHLKALEKKNTEPRLSDLFKTSIAISLAPLELIEKLFEDEVE